MKAHYEFRINGAGPLMGRARVPGDKSLSHRALLLGMLAPGESQISGWLPAGDTLATLAAVQSLGAQIDRLSPNMLSLRAGPLVAPAGPLNLVNTGTGLRLLAGLLAGQRFASVLDGSEQLRRRPMGRIVAPLSRMGANIRSSNNCAPLYLSPGHLVGLEHVLPVASAQVKSALLLAGLFADGPTSILEPGPSRDHTERLLAAMGATISVEGHRTTLTPGAPLSPLHLQIPGDPSSAAFLVVAAALSPDSHVVIEGVCLNPTRTGLFDVLKRMGADLTLNVTHTAAGEPVGDIEIRSSTLRGTQVGGPEVVRMIDEFPIFMVAALAAHGPTVVTGAQELRVKETDRLAVMFKELDHFGAQAEVFEDGFRVEGPQKLIAAQGDGHDDHRVAMALTVAALVAGGGRITDAACTQDSFPGFAQVMRGLGASLEQQ